MLWFDLTISLMMLTILEIILGIDNLVLLAVLTEKLPLIQRRKARYWGLTFAWVTRLLLLASAVWIVKLKTPIFYVYTHAFSWRDLFLLSGGFFLLYKATEEIHRAVVHHPEGEGLRLSKKNKFWFVVLQIGLLDIVFSLDSVLTAVGLTEHFFVMALAITIAIMVMVFASETVSKMIDKYPSLKILALSFLVLIGTVLIADGLSFHIPRAYIYFSMAFSLGVETLNILGKKR